MSTTTADNAAQLRFPPNVQYNASKIYTVKFLSSCFAGAVAGVLGLQNWLGFALFILATLLTSACLYVKCKARPAKYVAGGWWELLNPGQENIFSFVLVWTLFYGIVHGEILALASRRLGTDRKLYLHDSRYPARVQCTNPLLTLPSRCKPTPHYQNSDMPADVTPFVSCS
ncbi:hypothetical protein QCA50_000714 [Cerrena zonata]|uniref:ER membrane protein complex subunit 6 n=1 Tax=Cerrena zonata TaxID=2478898 RepID=A0AAW0GZG8_9APHY